jgi:hypothetical protein
MHGRIFWQIREYAEAKYGGGGWDRLLKLAGLQDRIYLPQPYPDSEAIALLTAASTMSKKSLPAVLEDFGEFTVPSLLTMYGHVIKPEWRSLDVIEHAESAAHGLVRRDQPGSAPPFLRTRRIGLHEVLLIYNSPRKLCAFAVGVGIGLGKYFEEAVIARHQMCMHEGADRCEIKFQILRPVGHAQQQSPK